MAAESSEHREKILENGFSSQCRQHDEQRKRLNVQHASESERTLLNVVYELFRALCLPACCSISILGPCCFNR